VMSDEEVDRDEDKEEASLTKSPSRASKSDDTPTEKIFLAEFIAALLLTICGVGSIWISALLEDDELQTSRLVFIGLVYGMVYTSLMYALSSTNNVRNINPAITLTLLFTRRQTFKQCLLLWAAQILGTLLGGLILPCTLPKNRTLNPYELLEDSTTFQQFFMDFMCSFLSTFVIIITCFDQPLNKPIVVETDVTRKRDASEKQPQTVHELNCIICGGTIFVCATIGSGISGGFMNPCFTVCLWAYTYKLKVAALFSPLVGSLMAFLVRGSIHIS